MKVLVVVSAFLVVASAVPQWPISYPWGLGSRSWPHEVSPYGIPAPIIYSLPSTLPLVITKEAKSIEIPKPVEDTPEVKSAREAFLVEWEKQARAAALSPDASVRKRRNVPHLLMPAPHLGGIPYAYSTVYGNPLNTHMSPYSGYEYLSVSPHVTTRVF